MAGNHVGGDDEAGKALISMTPGKLLFDRRSFSRRSICILASDRRSSSFRPASADSAMASRKAISRVVRSGPRRRSCRTDFRPVLRQKRWDVTLPRLRR